MKGVNHFDEIELAVKDQDVILTDSLSTKNREIFAPFQITLDLMRAASPGAVLNPCPPFCRGEEVTADVIDSNFFVGYEFKKALIDVQVAIMQYCFGDVIF